MKIAYSNKHLNYKLIFGASLLLFGLLTIDYNEENKWSDFGYLVFGIVYICIYIYENHIQYITIKDQTLTVNTFPKKSVRLKDIKQIKSFAGDYIIQTNNTKFTINTQIINPNSLDKMNATLKQLSIEWI